MATKWQLEGSLLQAGRGVLGDELSDEVPDVLCAGFAESVAEDVCDGLCELFAGVAVHGSCGFEAWSGCFVAGFRWHAWEELLTGSHENPLEKSGPGWAENVGGLSRPRGPSCQECQPTPTGVG